MLPLIVFVHTPKTAGSTVNSALASIGDGVSHIEKYNSNPNHILKIASSKRWISGHLTFDRFKSLLAGIDREVRYYSCIRNPDSQVMSHYNWLIEIFFKGKEFYLNHPENIKKISEEIRFSNRSDPTVLVELLVRYKLLFLNYQSKFILGGSSNDIPSKLSEYEFIAHDRNSVGHLINHVLNCSPLDGDRNKSRYHFDVRLFEDPIVKNCLRKHNSLDSMLYRSIIDKFNVD